ALAIGRDIRFELDAVDGADAPGIASVDVGGEELGAVFVADGINHPRAVLGDVRQATGLRATREAVLTATVAIHDKDILVAGLVRDVEDCFLQWRRRDDCRGFGAATAEQEKGDSGNGADAKES